MMKSFKKIWVSVASTACAFTSLLSADQLPPCPQECLPAFDSGCTTSCGRWSFISDTIYWTACQGGLTYGSESFYHTLGTTTTGADTEYHTKKKHPHRRWDLGWRLGIGYDFPCDCWNASLIWTYFDTDCHGRHEEDFTGNQWFTPAFTSIPFGGTGNTLLGGRTTPGAIESAKSQWKLCFNLLDLEIGREFCANSCLTVRPFLGIRGASINDKFRAKYTAVPFVTGTSTVVTVDAIDHVHLRNNFEGAGVRGGLDTSYDLGCGLSIYGGVAAALLYGETEIKSREIQDVTTTTVVGVELPTVVSNEFEHKQRDRDCGVRAITDAKVGIQWLWCCCGRLSVWQLGWEHHFFFHDNQFEKFTDYAGTDNHATDRYPQTLHGDLSVQGLVLTTKVFF